MEHHSQLRLLGCKDINCRIIKTRKAKNEQNTQEEDGHLYRKGY